MNRGNLTVNTAPTGRRDLNRLIGTIVLGSLLSGTLVYGSALVVNVDFNYSPSDNYTGQGALITADAHSWNDVEPGPVFNVITSDFTSGTLKASDGVTTTPFTVTLYHDFDTYFFAPPVGANNLQNDFLYNTGFASGLASTFSINHLVAGQPYDIYLYGAGGTYEGFAINGVTNVASRTSGFADTNAWVQNVDYVLFSHVVPTGTTITGSYFYSDNSNAGHFAGLQFTESLIPEPSTILLLSLGGTLLWKQARGNHRASSRT